MKYIFIRLNTILSAVVILLSFNIDRMLLRFILFGELPDETIVPASVMLGLMIAGTVGVLGGVFLSLAKSSLTLSSLDLPQHRYSRN